MSFGRLKFVVSEHLAKTEQYGVSWIWPTHPVFRLLRRLVPVCLWVHREGVISNPVLNAIRHGDTVYMCPRSYDFLKKNRFQKKEGAHVMLLVLCHLFSLTAIEFGLIVQINV